MLRFRRELRDEVGAAEDHLAILVARRERREAELARAEAARDASTREADAAESRLAEARRETERLRRQIAQDAPRGDRLGDEILALQVRTLRPPPTLHPRRPFFRRPEPAPTRTAVSPADPTLDPRPRAEHHRRGGQARRRRPLDGARARGSPRSPRGGPAPASPRRVRRVGTTRGDAPFASSPLHRARRAPRLRQTHRDARPGLVHRGRAMDRRRVGERDAKTRVVPRVKKGDEDEDVRTSDANSNGAVQKYDERTTPASRVATEHSRHHISPGILPHSETDSPARSYSTT